MEVIARLDNVTKTYGRVTALDSVSVTVPHGVTAVLGPNGAGKSTLVEILAGLRRPDAGTVGVLGGNPADIAVKGRLGLTPQRTALPWRLTPAETLDLVSAHYPNPVPRANLVERLNLGPFLAKRNGTLSGGQRRRVSLAAALIGNPDLVFLDEPTTGLDADSRDGLWAAISDVAADGRAVVLTTHDMAEAESLASRVVVIAKGQVARVGSIDEVVAEVGLHLVEAEIAGILPPLAVSGPADRVERAGNRTRIFTADPDATVRALVRANVDFRHISVGRVGLEEAIRSITSETVEHRTLEKVA